MKKSEVCLNCGCDYIPKRRGIQKFCSNSCRSRSWTLKQNRIKVPVKDDNLESLLPDVKNKTEREAMSLAGVGNAAAGVVGVELFKSVLTKNENKPATKRDIQELKTMIMGGRYLPVNNGQNDTIGRKPFYDIETENIVYLSVEL